MSAYGISKDRTANYTPTERDRMVLHEPDVKTVCNVKASAPRRK